MEKIFKKKTGWGLVFGLSVFSIIMLIVLKGFLQAWIEEIMRGDGIPELFFVPIAIMVLTLLFIFNIILWQIRGQETVCMDNEKLVIKKGKRLFNIPKAINIYEIDEIFFEPYPAKFFSASSFLEMVGLRGGKICVEYKGRYVVYIGQSISDEEAKKCVEEMNVKLLEFNKQHLHPQNSQKRKIKKIFGFPIMSLENITTLMAYLFFVMGWAILLLVLLAVNRGMFG